MENDHEAESIDLGSLLLEKVHENAELNVAEAGRQEYGLLYPLVNQSHRFSEFFFGFPALDSLDFETLNLLQALGEVDWKCPTSPLASASCTRLVAGSADVYSPHIFNKALAYAIRGTKEKGRNHPALRSHALFRSTLWSHNDSERRLLAHPLWQALQAINDYVFKGWNSKAQKIAMMYLCSQLLEVRTNP